VLLQPQMASTLTDTAHMKTRVLHMGETVTERQ
jgi:hypothetical protein